MYFFFISAVLAVLFIWLHHFLYLKRAPMVKSLHGTLEFFISCILLHVVGMWILQSPIPLSSSLFLALILAIYTIFLTSVYLDDVSPSATIFAALLKRPLAERELIELFTDEQLVGKRLRQLLESGLISKNSQQFVITKKGQRLRRFIQTFYQLLNWKS